MSDLRSYAYYIEVSVDQKDWVRVIDHSKYFCRSWQNLYFEPRVVQYIKLVGTSNTVNKVSDPGVYWQNMYCQGVVELIIPSPFLQIIRYYYYASFKIKCLMALQHYLLVGLHKGTSNLPRT